MSSPVFCMAYDMRFLGSGPHFDEMAKYFSFEQIIHYAFDGFYSSFDSEATEEWKDIIDHNLTELLDSDYSLPITIDKRAIVEYYISQMSMYVGWLGKYVAFPKEGYHTVVQNVIINYYDVYVVCDNLEGPVYERQLQ